MSKTKRLASLISGIGLVVVFVAWLGLRDGLLATVSIGIAVPLLLHGIAWIVLLGGVSLIAAASAAVSHPGDRDRDLDRFDAGRTVESNLRDRRSSRTGGL